MLVETVNLRIVGIQPSSTKCHHRVDVGCEPTIFTVSILDLMDTRSQKSQQYSLHLHSPNTTNMIHTGKQTWEHEIFYSEPKRRYNIPWGWSVKSLNSRFVMR